jgi:Fe-Mn family superoxide dismutase
MQHEYVPVTLPELSFGYNSLEPILTGEILEVHHKKHHQAYINNYNTLIQDLVKKAYEKDSFGVQNLCGKVAFHAGGHNAHAWYWENLAPADNGGGILPDEKSPLTKAVLQHFGNYENFIKGFNAKTGAIQGSGWGWLAYDPATKGLSIQETANQDQVATKGLVPLLTVDVWEHAYYLQYKNLRPDYLTSIWKVINWRCVEERYNKATGYTA